MTENSRLKSFIDRIERLNAEKAELQDDIKDLYTEVRSAGYDVKAVRAIIRERAQDEQKRRELEETVDLYKAELGILSDTPLGQAAVKAEAYRNDGGK